MFQHFDAVASRRVHPWHMATIVLSAAAHTAAIGTLVRLPGRQAVEWTAEQATIIAYLAANPPPAAARDDGERDEARPGDERDRRVREDRDSAQIRPYIQRTDERL